MEGFEVVNDDSSVPADTSYAVVKNSGEVPKFFKFSNIWSWILSKIKAATLSALDTSDKSPVNSTAVNSALTNYPKIQKTTLSYNKSLTLTHSTDTSNVFIWRVSIQGNIGQLYASYLIQGYGSGGENRDHIYTHYQGTALTITNTDNVFTITNTNSLNGIAKVVIETLQGEQPTIE